MMIFAYCIGATAAVWLFDRFMTRLQKAYRRRLEVIEGIQKSINRDMDLLRLAILRQPGAHGFCSDYLHEKLDRGRERFEAVSIRRMALEFWKPIDSYYKEMD